MSYECCGVVLPPVFLGGVLTDGTWYCPTCHQKYFVDAGVWTKSVGVHGGVNPNFVDPPKVDLINHPPHYASLKPEPIEVIESWQLGYCLGCAVKYIARAGKKDGAPIIQDLEKARWYLTREIERLNIEEKK
jgi:hypothetical protein